MTEETGPPVVMLVLAFAAVAGSVGLLVGVSLTAHVLGYLLSSFVCIGLATAFTQLDERRRNDQERWYEEEPGQKETYQRARAVALSLGIVVTTIHVWYIARELSVA